MQEFRDTGGNGQAMELSENVPLTSIAEWSPTYSAPECQSVVVVVNPCYGVLDVKTKEAGETSSSPDPAYETPGVKREQDKRQSDPGYESIVVVKEGHETVEDKRKEMNGDYFKKDIHGDMKNWNTKKDGIEGANSESTYSKSDKKRETSDVNGKGRIDSDFYKEPGYETPDVKKEKFDGASPHTTYAKPNKKRKDDKSDDNTDSCYEESGHGIPDCTKEETDGTSPDVTYAKPDKKRSEGNAKSGESIVPDSYEERGYETPLLRMEDTKGSSTDKTYAKPDKKRSEGNIKRGESIVSDSYGEPGYENLKKEDTDGRTSDTAYAKPDKKEKEAECQNHPGSDNSTKSDKEIAVHTSPGIKRIEINGDLYALPNKSKNGEKVRVYGRYITGLRAGGGAIRK